MVINGPVHPIVAAPGARRHGEVIATRHAGWYDAKTLWHAKASYPGPVLIRGQRLDGPGTVTFGEGPRLGFLADTGAANRSSHLGVRA